MNCVEMARKIKLIYRKGAMLHHGEAALCHKGEYVSPKSMELSCNVTALP